MPVGPITGEKWLELVSAGHNWFGSSLTSIPYYILLLLEKVITKRTLKFGEAASLLNPVPSCAPTAALLLASTRAAGTIITGRSTSTEEVSPVDFP